MPHGNPLNIPDPGLLSDWLYGLISTSGMDRDMMKHNFNILEGAVMAFGIANLHAHNADKPDFNALHRRGLDLLAAYVPAELKTAWECLDRHTMEASRFCSQGVEEGMKGGRNASR